MNLLPCPFCGSDKVLFENDTGPNDEGYLSWVECDDCGATAHNEAAWNTRQMGAENDGGVAARLRDLDALLALFKTTEINDDGVEFHPVTISSSRVALSIELRRILNRLEEIGGRLAPPKSLLDKVPSGWALESVSRWNVFTADWWATLRETTSTRTDAKGAIGTGPTPEAAVEAAGREVKHE